MNRDKTTIRRPTRWEVPFAESHQAPPVRQLLSREPFSRMESNRFPQALPLEGILRNDCRLLQRQAGDVIIREGDYGSSAFLLLEGTVIVCLEKVFQQWRSTAGKQPRRGMLARTLSHWLGTSVPEYRSPEQLTPAIDLGTRHSGAGTCLFVQDVPRLLDETGTVELQAGEIFGELAALTRSPRTATVLAADSVQLLEIRWQGLRDLLRFDPALKQHVEELYRRNSLQVHLRETPLFAGLDDSSLGEVANAAQFESFGEFEWHHDFRRQEHRRVAQRLEREPVIVAEREFAGDLVLIRSGFARVSQSKGAGHVTQAYLGKGDVFGLPELFHNWKQPSHIPYQSSLRAVGHVDVLRIPAHVLESHVFSQLPDEQQDIDLFPLDSAGHSMDQLEFLVDERLINGTEAMVIDLNRCTRCDDCVRACASAHDNNPRFVRSGPTFDGLMFASACMHCADPVCMIGCPTGAIQRVPGAGTIVIDERTCVGCSVCADSCPYNNIRMVEVRDRAGRPIHDGETDEPIQKATKCDLCHDLPQGPACQRSCPHDALIRIDLRNVETLEQWRNR